MAKVTKLRPDPTPEMATLHAALEVVHDEIDRGLIEGVVVITFGPNRELKTRMIGECEPVDLHWALNLILHRLMNNAG